MHNNIAKQIRDAYARLAKPKTKIYKAEQTLQIETDATYNNGNKISIYAYTLPNSGKIYFTDAGVLAKLIASSGQPVQWSVLQHLFTSYNLTLLPDNSVLEQTDRPLHERITAIWSAQLGVDAMIRTWQSYAELVHKNREKGEGTNEDQ